MKSGCAISKQQLHYPSQQRPLDFRIGFKCLEIRAVINATTQSNQSWHFDITHFNDKMGRRAAGFLIFRRINAQVEYLLLKASYGSYHWTPPKGHVDPGEDDFTTALRETREEAGYTDADLNIFKTQTKTLNYQVKGKPKAVVYWLAELRNPNSDPKLSDEHTEFRWLAKDEAIELSGFKDFADMIEYFDHSIPSLQS